MKIGFTMICFTSLLLTACSKSPHQDYLGYWVQEDPRFTRVVKISQDGDTYLIKYNIFSAKKRGGRGENKPLVLSKTNDKLSINSGFGGIELGLSEDKKTLFADGKTYKRIEDTTDIEKNVIACHNLKAEIRDALDKAGLMKRADTLKKFETKITAIPYCG